MTTRRSAWPYALAAVGLAAAGAAVNIWRPLAPPIGTVDSGLITFSEEVLRLVEDYNQPRRVAVVASTLVGLAVPAAVVLTAPGRRALHRVAGPRRHSPARAALVGVATVVAVDVARLPIAFAIGYVHDGRWGFRTSPLGGWARDWLVGHTPGWIVIAAAAAVGAAAVARWPGRWHWGGVVVGTAAAAVLTLGAPLVLEPLWLRTTPLEEGSTRAAVEQVLDRADEERAEILVGDASRRTTRVNAYVSGLGPTRRVVLFDTLLELPPEQVATVVAHELAHREHRDIPRSVLLSATGLLPGLLALRWVVDPRRGGRIVGARDRSDPRLVALALAAAAGLTLVGQPIATAVSRRAEAAADHRALELTEDPATAVRMHRGFVVRQLTDPRPPAWYVIGYAGHPPPARRIAAAVAYAGRNELPLPALSELADEERDVAHDGPD